MLFPCLCVVSPHSSVLPPSFLLCYVVVLCSRFLLDDNGDSSSSVVACLFAAPVAVASSAAEACWEASTRGRRGSSLAPSSTKLRPPEQMGAWLSVFSRAPGQLTITATSTGVPGFPVGKALSFFAGPGETVGMVVERLNKYRGPDSQIEALRYGGGDRMGDPLLFSTVVEGSLQAML